MDPEEAQAGFVSGEFFPVLGMTPLMGRWIEEGAVRGEERVAVIGHTLWLKRFGGSARVLGEAIEVDGRPFAVIGVMPREFRFPAMETQLWLPISTNRFWRERPAADGLHTRGFVMRWNLVARLRPGGHGGDGAGGVAGNGPSPGGEGSGLEQGSRIRAAALGVEVSERARRALWWIFGAVALVLLMAGANVANLLLARGASRTREMAVRLALGAGRGRIVRQMLTECLVLVGVASVLAMLLAGGFTRLLVRLGPPDLPRLGETGLDGFVMLFGLTASLLTAVLFGAGPAWQASRQDPQNSLRGVGRGVSSPASGFLVMAELALAIVLTASAGLLLRSLWNVEAVDLGYDVERVLALRLRLPDGVTTAPVRERLRAVPGVEQVGGIRSLFELSGATVNRLRAVEGAAEVSALSGALTWTTVSGDYFRAMGIPLLAGRHFSEGDRAGSGLVAMIDESMARRYWPGRDPVGQRFKGQDRRGANDDWITVIGVVRDAWRQGVEREPTPHVFLWEAQEGPVADWVIRTAGHPLDLAAAVRQATREVEPRAVVVGVAPMEELLDAQIRERRFQAWLIALFAGLAMVLAAVGIFGVMSHAAARRTQEIGLRMALGADCGRVIWLILGRGLALAGVGLVAGSLAAVGVAQVLASSLFGVAPVDPVSFGGAVVVLLGVGVSATLVPAWRASRLDPMVALRRD